MSLKKQNDKIILVLSRQYTRSEENSLIIDHYRKMCIFDLEEKVSRIPQWNVAIDRKRTRILT